MNATLLRETSAQVFSCEYYVIFSKTPFLQKNIRKTASAFLFKGYLRYKTILCYRVALDV